MTYLHGIIENQIERTDLMAYDTIFYYYINADLKDSFDI